MGEATVVASSDAADSERRGSAGLEKQTLVDRRRSPLILAVAAVLVVAIVGGAAWWWVSFTRSPAYSLGRLAAAVQQNNWDGVQKYVDVDSVIGQAVDAAVSKSLEKDTSGLGALVAGLAQSMKPALIQQAKEGFKKSIEQGSTSSSGTADSLGGYFGAKKVKSVTYIGDEALVTVEASGENGKPLDLKLKMKRVDNFWRVSAIENILDLPGSNQNQSQ